jgi:hypothetical protein
VHTVGQTSTVFMVSSESIRMFLHSVCGVSEHRRSLLRTAYLQTKEACSARRMLILTHLNKNSSVAETL